MSDFIKENLKGITALKLTLFKGDAFARFTGCYLDRDYALGVNSNGKYIVKLGVIRKAFDSADDAVKFYKETVTEAYKKLNP